MSILYKASIKILPILLNVKPLTDNPVKSFSRLSVKKISVKEIKIIDLYFILFNLTLLNKLSPIIKTNTYVVTMRLSAVNLERNRHLQEKS